MKKTNKVYLSKRQGFTLIELLIVIAIIGILAGVILVSTSSARNKAIASTTKQTLSSLKSALTVCCSTTGAQIQAIAATAGATGDICDLDPVTAGVQGMGTSYPTATDLKLPAAATVAYAIPANGNCDGSLGDPQITVTLSAHPNAACSASAWTLKTYGSSVIPAGC